MSDTAAWVQTFTGRKVPLLNPPPGCIDPLDIAHALGHLCRFGGHCLSFFSVAEHSVVMSRMVPPEYALRALLHDGSEAYLGDLTKPLKSLLPRYRTIERAMQRAVYARFGLTMARCPAVDLADLRMLATEKLWLLVPEPAPWIALPEPYPDALLDCWAPKMAAALWLRRYEELTDAGVR